MPDDMRGTVDGKHAVNAPLRSAAGIKCRKGDLERAKYIDMRNI